MIVAAIIVFAFMIAYYRFAGIVACLAVVLNLTMLLALMILLKAAFTLPGACWVDFDRRYGRGRQCADLRTYP
jgi:hypothetical protein